MQKMKALVKDGGSLAVRSLPEPVLKADDEVVVQVMLAGLCRTDLYAAAGIIKTPDPLVLGHEFAGVVTRVGGTVEHLSPGARVTVNPLLPCKRCRFCLSGQETICQHTKFLGVDRDGCFAGYIAVPACSARPLPENLPYLAAAYTEPVAASLAVLKAGIRPDDKGLIYGHNRFSQLLQQIMRLYGFLDVPMFDPFADRALLDEDSYDFIVETMVSTETLSDMIRAIRPGGKLVLKSRQYEPILLRMNELIKKEPILHVVNYGSFEDALALLASGQISVEALVDGIYKLESFEDVLIGARQTEALKPFFAPWEE